MIVERGYLNWFGNPDLWILYNYWQIVAVVEVLRSHVSDWSQRENQDKLRGRLHDTLKVVHDRFGTRGEKCQGEDWALDDGSRFTEEDKLEGKVIQTANKPLVP